MCKRDIAILSVFSTFLNFLKPISQCLTWPQRLICVETRQSVFSAKCLFSKVSFRQSGFRRSVVHRCGRFDLKSPFLGKLRPERLTGSQMVSQQRTSFAWRHKLPIYFFRPQWAAASSKQII